MTPANRPNQQDPKMPAKRPQMGTARPRARSPHHHRRTSYLNLGLVVNAAPEAEPNPRDSWPAWTDFPVALAVADPAGWLWPERFPELADFQTRERGHG